MPVAPEHAGGGPVYFAWVGPTETTFGPEHVRYDEYIRRFDITLEEGKLPLASIDIKNPGALLADGRERWAWFAFDDDAGVRQAFFGAIVGIPSDLFDSIITVQLIAKPLDYLARKQAVAETLKADPDFYNQYLVDPKYWDDPDTILEARSANWHHDPVSHAVTISDLLVGEDGEQEFFGADVIRGSVQFTIGEAPKGAVAMDLSVVWTQTATGIVDLGHKLFGSYTATSILDSWPKTLETFDGGWSVEGSAAIDVFNTFSTQAVSYQYSWQNPQKEHINGDAMSVTENYNGPPPGIFGKEINYKRTESFVIGDPETGRAASTSIQETSTIVLGGEQPLVRTELSLRYNAKRDRTEHVRFTLTAGQQAIVTEASGSDDIKTLTLKGADVGIALGDDPAPPIGDLSRRTFFPTEQGQQMIVYAINVARADLLTDSRVASASFDCRFRRALQLSCRMNAILHHPKVPGGVMVGKILKIVLSGEGSTGLFKGNVTIGAACGTGVALEAVAGDPTYVDADVLGADVQVFANRFVVLGTGDIGYPPPVDQANDDGLVFPLTYDQVVVRDEIKSGDVSQAAAISQAASPAGGDPTSATDLAQQGATQASAVSAAFANANVWYELELKPVDNGPFEDAFVFDVAMSLPKQLDLGAGG